MFSNINYNFFQCIHIKKKFFFFSEQFVEIWQGRLLNVHPAILPAFKGAKAHKLVLEAGARITGCTVHFVEVFKKYLFIYLSLTVKK